MKIQNLGGSGNLIVDAVEFSDPATVPGSPSDEGLVTHFTLDEESGPSGGDTAPQGVADTAILAAGASWSAAGITGNAVRFDGVDDLLSVPDSTDFNGRITSKATISLWFNADDVNRAGKQLLYKQSGSNRGLNIYLDGGQLYVGGWSGEANGGPAHF